MKLENLPHYLRSHSKDDLVVEFDDGDRYPAAALDLSGENSDGEFEVSVQFEVCLGRSQAEAKALEAGSLQRSPPFVWWTSESPLRPVGMCYTTRQILSIYDNEACYAVYEREQAD